MLGALSLIFDINGLPAIPGVADDSSLMLSSYTVDTINNRLINAIDKISKNLHK